MAMKYQQGTVYFCGKKVKKWYGKFLIYGQDQQGKEVRKHRNVAICPKAGNPKWKAEQLLREMILKECGVLTEMPVLPSDDSLTFRWFVKERYIPMRQGKWEPGSRSAFLQQSGALTSTLLRHFTAKGDAQSGAFLRLYQQLQMQASVLSYVDVLRSLGFFCACMVPLVLLMKKPPVGMKASAH